MAVISAAELDNGDYRVEYLVENILVAKQPAIVGGRHKTLKTSILAELAVSLASGRKLLDTFAVKRACRVGVVSCESGLGVLQETLRRICSNKELVLRDLDHLILSNTIPRLDDPAWISALSEFCTDNELEVLILDPAYLMMSGTDAGNLFAMGERLAGLNKLTTDTGVTVILAHHLKRANGQHAPRYAPPEMEELAWAGFAEFARQWLLLGRRGPYKDGSGHHELWMRAGGSAGHSGLYGVDVHEGRIGDPGGRVWRVRVQPGGQIIEAKVKEQVDRKAKKMQEQDDEGQRAIVEALSELPEGEGVFPAKLGQLASMGDARLKRLLKGLVDTGAVEECEARQAPNHKNKKNGAYRLTSLEREAV